MCSNTRTVESEGIQLSCVEFKGQNASNIIDLMKQNTVIVQKCGQTLARVRVSWT